MANWNPWTGCRPHSEGCTYCYFYGLYSKRRGADIEKTAQFYRPLEKKSANRYKIESGATVATCFDTDFFIEEADEWRKEAWQMIRERQDLNFMMLTKRIDRFEVSLPEDWGDGYENVQIGCTCESQEYADYRLPLFLSAPIKHRFIACSPMLGPIDLKPYLHGVETVSVGGEAGRDARPCNLNWVMDIRSQCQAAGVSFWFKCTGKRFIKDGEMQLIPPRMQHAAAREMNLNL